VRIGVHIYFRPGFGGGERYLLTAAEALRSLGEVDFIAPTPVDLAAFERQFALDLSAVRPVQRPRRPLHGIRDYLSPRPYDFFFALDNHLAPVQSSLGKRGVLHLQTPPYPDPVDHPVRSRMKLRTYDLVACNSEYTRRWAQRYGTAGLPARILYPPVDVDLYRPAPKRPMVLSVGRFFTGRHEKKHGLLIDCFRDLVKSGMEGWELHLAGSFRDDITADRAYLAELEGAAQGLPVVFHVNAELAEIRRLYGEASVYWHATGHGVDEEAHPQFLEHFGMSVVEAMAAGAIPVVVGRGGLVEIVENERTGFLWDEPADLLRRTRELAAVPEPTLASFRERVVAAAKRFSRARFADEVRALARELTGC